MSAAPPAYQHVDPDGRLTFHGPDGEMVTVTAEPFTPTAPWQQAYLDECPFVKRATATAKPSGAKNEEA